MWLQSAHNDTIELCGKRDGLALRLSGYQGILSVVFKSLSKSTKRGFSCRLKADQDQGIQEELETAVESTDGEEAQGFVGNWLRILNGLHKYSSYLTKTVLSLKTHSNAICKLKFLVPMIH